MQKLEEMYLIHYFGKWLLFNEPWKKIMMDIDIWQKH